MLFTKAEVQTSDNGEEFVLIEGYANTVDEDRVGDVIPMSTWKDPESLMNYQKNPIVLAFHDHKQPIGTAIELNVDSKGLWIKAKISSANEYVYKAVKAGILKALSVGFRLKDIEYDEDHDRWILTKLELHEISVVSVPCNQDSIFSLAKSLNHSDYMDLIKLKDAKQTAKPSEDKEEVSQLYLLAQAIGCLKEENI